MCCILCGVSLCSKCSTAFHLEDDLPAELREMMDLEESGVEDEAAPSAQASLSDLLTVATLVGMTSASTTSTTPVPFSLVGHDFDE